MESPRPAGGPVLDSPLLGSGSLAHSSSHLSPLSESLPLSRRTITHHRTWEFILLLTPRNIFKLKISLSVSTKFEARWFAPPCWKCESMTPGPRQH